MCLFGKLGRDNPPQFSFFDEGRSKLANPAYDRDRRLPCLLMPCLFRQSGSSVGRSQAKNRPGLNPQLDGDLIYPPERFRTRVDLQRRHRARCWLGDLSRDHAIAP